MSEFDLGCLTGVLATSLTLLTLVLILVLTWRPRWRRRAERVYGEWVEEKLLNHAMGINRLARRVELLEHGKPIDPDRDRRAAVARRHFGP